MSTEKNTAVAKQSNSAVAKTEMSHSERFTTMVLKEFTGSTDNSIELTSFQRKLIQNYFIKLDVVLKEADKKRLSKRPEEQDSLAFSWENVNMAKLATDVVAYSSVGLDPIQPNHINLIPYKNTLTQKYDIGFIMGYKGVELKAMKYGFNIPDDVIVELVYSSDVFKAVKKDMNNRIESYVLEINNEFDRGDILGGFYYHVYRDNPEKNKLRVYTMKDIEKRKPKYASVEFWGGEKDKWVNGKKDGKEAIEGWLEEMCYKTVYRGAFNAITIDSEKIDDHFHKMIEVDTDRVGTAVAAEINQNANKEELGFSYAEEVNDENLALNQKNPDNASEETSTSNTAESTKVDTQQAAMTGPGF